MKKVKLTLTVVPHALGELLEYIETTSGISADEMSMVNPPRSNGVIIPPSNKLGTCLPKHHQDPRLVMKLVRSEKTPWGYEIIDADASLFKLGLTREYLKNTVCKVGTAENSVKHALAKQSKKEAA
jgi:hypothetical protein